MLFFVLAAIAATGAMLSLLEVPVAYLNERFHMSRTAATITTVVLLALVGSTAALSNSLTADVKLFGMTMFDFYDFVTSNILLAVACCWDMGCTVDPGCAFPCWSWAAGCCCAA